MINRRTPGETPGNFNGKGVYNLALNMLVVGHRCAFYRKKILKCTQVDVANETGFSVGNISAFETGRNDSSLILLWYMCHGMTLEMVMGGVPVA